MAVIPKRIFKIYVAFFENPIWRDELTNRKPLNLPDYNDWTPLFIEDVQWENKYLGRTVLKGEWTDAYMDGKWYNLYQESPIDVLKTTFFYKIQLDEWRTYICGNIKGLTGNISKTSDVDILSKHVYRTKPQVNELNGIEYHDFKGKSINASEYIENIQNVKKTVKINAPDFNLQNDKSYILPSKSFIKGYPGDGNAIPLFEFPSYKEKLLELVKDYFHDKELTIGRLLVDPQNDLGKYFQKRSKKEYLTAYIKDKPIYSTIINQDVLVDFSQINSWDVENIQWITDFDSKENIYNFLKRFDVPGIAYTKEFGGNMVKVDLSKSQKNKYISIWKDSKGVIYMGHNPKTNKYNWTAEVFNGQRFPYYISKDFDVLPYIDVINKDLTHRISVFRGILDTPSYKQRTWQAVTYSNSPSNGYRIFNYDKQTNTFSQSEVWNGYFGDKWIKDINGLMTRFFGVELVEDNDVAGTTWIDFNFYRDRYKTMCRFQFKPYKNWNGYIVDYDYFEVDNERYIKNFQALTDLDTSVKTPQTLEEYKRFIKQYDWEKYFKKPFEVIEGEGKLFHFGTYDIVTKWFEDWDVDNPKLNSSLPSLLVEPINRFNPNLGVTKVGNSYMVEYLDCEKEFPGFVIFELKGLGLDVIAKYIDNKLTFELIITDEKYYVKDSIGELELAIPHKEDYHIVQVINAQTSIYFSGTNIPIPKEAFFTNDYSGLSIDYIGTSSQVATRKYLIRWEKYNIREIVDIIEEEVIINNPNQIQYSNLVLRHRQLKQTADIDSIVMERRHAHDKEDFEHRKHSEKVQWWSDLFGGISNMGYSGIRRIYGADYLGKHGGKSLPSATLSKTLGGIQLGADALAYAFNLAQSTLNYNQTLKEGQRMDVDQYLESIKLSHTHWKEEETLRQQLIAEINRVKIPVYTELEDIQRYCQTINKKKLHIVVKIPKGELLTSLRDMMEEYGVELFVPNITVNLQKPCFYCFTTITKIETTDPIDPYVYQMLLKKLQNGIKLYMEEWGGKFLDLDKFVTIRVNQIDVLTKLLGKTEFDKEAVQFAKDNADKEIVTLKLADQAKLEEIEKKNTELEKKNQEIEQKLKDIEAEKNKHIELSEKHKKDLIQYELNKDQELKKLRDSLTLQINEHKLGKTEAEQKLKDANTKAAKDIADKIAEMKAAQLKCEEDSKAAIKAEVDRLSKITEEQQAQIAKLTSEVQMYKDSGTFNFEEATQKVNDEVKKYSKNKGFINDYLPGYWLKNQMIGKEDIEDNLKEDYGFIYLVKNKKWYDIARLFLLGGFAIKHFKTILKNVGFQTPKEIDELFINKEEDNTEFFNYIGSRGAPYKTLKIKDFMTTDCNKNNGGWWKNIMNVNHMYINKSLTQLIERILEYYQGQIEEVDKNKSNAYIIPMWFDFGFFTFKNNKWDMTELDSTYINDVYIRDKNSYKLLQISKGISIIHDKYVPGVEAFQNNFHLDHKYHDFTNGTQTYFYLNTKAILDK